jgi:hypothetical protein
MRVDNVIEILYKILGLVKPEPVEGTTEEIKQAELSNLFEQSLYTFEELR